VHDHGVALADEAEHRRQPWPGHVFARGMLGERPVGLDAVELTADVLVQAADAGLGNSLPAHRDPLTSICQVEL
jgi:hypothetical protein